MLDDDYERLGLRPPTAAQRTHGLRAALDAAMPGKLTDESIHILAEFIRAKMNDADYPLIFATILQQTKGFGTLEMIGGSPQDSSLLFSLDPAPVFSSFPTSPPPSFSPSHLSLLTPSVIL